MLLLVLIAFVAFVLFSPKPPVVSEEHETRNPAGAAGGEHGGGGIDGSTLGEIAGGAVTLGGTIVAALGGHAGAGAVAGGSVVVSGGQVAGGTGGGAVAAEKSAEAAALGAGEASAVGSAGAAGVALGILVLIALGITAAELMRADAAAMAWWQKVYGSKRKTLFARWFRWEESRVQEYLTRLASQRGGAVPHTETFINTIDDRDRGGFPVQRYVVNSISDPEAAGVMPALRAVARWWSVQRSFHANEVSLAFWAACGKPPPAAAQVNGFFDQTDKNSPAMLQRDFLALADDYLTLQPFASVALQYETPDLAGGDSRGLADFNAPQVPIQTSYQPYGKLGEKSLSALGAKVSSLLGNELYGQHYAQAELWGRCEGYLLAAQVGYTLWEPDAWVWTQEMYKRCGNAWPIISVVAPDGNFRWCAIHESTGYAFDMDASKNVGSIVLYSPGTWRAAGNADNGWKQF